LVTQIIGSLRVLVLAIGLKEKCHALVGRGMNTGALVLDASGEI